MSDISNPVSPKDWKQIHHLAIKCVNLSSSGKKKLLRITEQRLKFILRSHQKMHPNDCRIPMILADYVNGSDLRMRLLVTAYRVASRYTDYKNMGLIASEIASEHLDRKHLRMCNHWLNKAKAFHKSSSDELTRFTIEHLQAAIRIAKQRSPAQPNFRRNVKHRLIARKKSPS